MRTLFNARLPMGRLPQFVGQAAVAAGVLAGGASLLNAGGAHALTCSPNTAGTFTLSDVTILSGLASTCEIANFPPTNPNLASVDVNFGPPTIVGPTTGSYWYSLTSTSPYQEFQSISMNMDIGGLQAASATKNIYSAPPNLSGLFDPLTLIGTVTTTGGSTAFVNLTNQTLSTIYVGDSFIIGNSTSLNSISNNFVAVPGPLPIFGAGAAFGFSRKLRSRIKAGRTA
jgi:hypothetical protein